MTSAALDDLRTRAQALVAGRRPADAVALLAPALVEDPWDVATLIVFAEAQLSWDNLAEAEAACRMALDRDATAWTARRLLGHVLIERDRVPEAIDTLASVVQQAPDDAASHHLYGVSLQYAGRLDDAGQQYRAAISLNPGGAARSYLRLSELNRVSEDDGLIAELEHALASTDPEADDDQSSLHYALGKAYDDVREWDRAFEHVARAARLRRAAVDYAETEALDLIDRVQSLFTPQLLTRRALSRTNGVTPVFIVGMPRSGSTLIEQILSRHSRVRCVGESLAFAEQLACLRRDQPTLPLFPELLTALDDAALQHAARGYIEAFGASSRTHLVNKQLGNLLFVGAIRMALPDARFVMAERDSLDTCLSIYMRSFDDRLPYSHDLGELGRQYRRQQQLMAYWRSVLPTDAQHTVRYEAVVDDAEREVRTLLEFLDLPWEPGCLAFHESTQPVRTASSAQVRRPLYRDALGRSEHYRRHLGPLIDALEPPSRPARE